MIAPMSSDEARGRIEALEARVIQVTAALTASQEHGGYQDRSRLAQPIPALFHSCNRERHPTKGPQIHRRCNLLWTTLRSHLKEHDLRPVY